MSQANKLSVPSWIWNMALAADYCSLDYDESFVPDYVWEAWKDHLPIDCGVSEVVLKFLAECDPIQAHHFLHCAGHYHDHFQEWKVVLERSDCDQATAMTYFSWFYNYIEEPDKPSEWIDKNQLQLMSLIRSRAWNGEFKRFDFDLPEHCLLELNDMRKLFVSNKNHFFSLPPSFLPRTKSENFYYKLRDKFLLRSFKTNQNVSTQIN